MVRTLTLTSLSIKLCLWELVVHLEVPYTRLSKRWMNSKHIFICNSCIHCVFHSVRVRSVVRKCISKIMMPHFTSSIKNYCRKIPFSPRDNYEVYLPFSKSLAVYSNKMALSLIVAPDYPLFKENKQQLYYEVTLLSLCYHHRCSGNKLMSGK